MTPSWQPVIAEMAAASDRGRALARPYTDPGAAQAWLDAQPWVRQVWPHTSRREVISELYRVIWWRAVVTGGGEGFERPSGIEVFADGHLWPKDQRDIEFSQGMLALLRRLQDAAGSLDRVLDRFEEALYGEQWRWDIQHPRTLDGYPPLDLRDFAAVRHEVLCRAGHELWLELTGWEIWHENRDWGVGFLKSRRPGGHGEPLDPAALRDLLERAAQLPVLLGRVQPLWPSILAAKRACRPLPDELPAGLAHLLQGGAGDMFRLHWPGVADEPATRLEQLSAAYVASFGTGGGPWWLDGWRLLAKHYQSATTS